MQHYEYKVIPAPDRGEKTRGAKTPSDRYAQALTSVLNRMAREGWDYVRAEMLPSEERSGLTRRVTVYHNMLVFRRPVEAAPDRLAPQRQLTAEAAEGKAPRLESPAAPPAPAPAPEVRVGATPEPADETPADTAPETADTKAP